MYPCRLVIQADRAARLSHEPPDNCQSHAGARAICRETLLENKRHERGLDPSARVGHQDMDPVVAQAQNLNHGTPPRLQRLSRIAEQVHQNRRGPRISNFKAPASSITTGTERLIIGNSAGAPGSSAHRSKHVVVRLSGDTELLNELAQAQEGFFQRLASAHVLQARNQLLRRLQSACAWSRLAVRCRGQAAGTLTRPAVRCSSDPALFLIARQPCDKTLSTKATACTYKCYGRSQHDARNVPDARMSFLQRSSAFGTRRIGRRSRDDISSQPFRPPVLRTHAVHFS
jgi:hypothetical protein